MASPARNHRVDHLRVPPASPESEQAVLGGLMLAPESIDLVMDLITEDDFFIHVHRLIFRAIKHLNERSKPFDVITLGEWFDSQGMAEQVSNGAYLIELSTNTPSAANIRAYAEIVRDKALVRRLIDKTTLIQTDAYQSHSEDAAAILARAEQAIFSISESTAAHRAGPVMVTDSAREVFSLLQDRYENKGNPTGIPTPYKDFNDLTAGLQPTDLIILAARPSQGKTTLALNLAEHAAFFSKKPTVVFSMEMSHTQLTTKLISSLGRINASRLRDGELQDEDWSKVTRAIQVMKEGVMLIDDTPSLSPDELRSKARRLKREHNIGLIVVDYLQLMTVPGSTENRATEISEISRSLKALAKELKVPVIALSQLNRSLETRNDKRPVMADLRESGAIEQDADVIVFIYRDEYYNKDSETNKGLAEIIIGKQRNGPTGTVTLRFFGEFSKFDNLGRNGADSFE